MWAGPGADLLPDAGRHAVGRTDTKVVQIRPWLRPAALSPLLRQKLFNIPATSTSLSVMHMPTAPSARASYLESGGIPQSNSITSPSSQTRVLIVLLFFG
jgi:hypothetical protein